MSGHQGGGEEGGGAVATGDGGKGGGEVCSVLLQDRPSGLQAQNLYKQIIYLQIM